MDNIQQGFFTIDKSGKINKETSKFAFTLLGKEFNESPFSELIPSKAEIINRSLKNLRDRPKQAKFTLKLLPKEVNLGKKIALLDYRPIFDEDKKTSGNNSEGRNGRSVG